MRFGLQMIAFVAAGSLIFAGAASAEKRVWTAKSGHRVIATMEDQTEEAVSLKIANRPNTVVVMIDQLIEEDQAFVKRSLLDQQKLRISKPGDYTRRMENPLFADYVFRLNDRRAAALEARREYNSRKGPAVFYIGTMPDPMFPFGIGIQRGWVQQPRSYNPYPRYRYPRVRIDDFVPSYSD